MRIEAHRTKNLSAGRRQIDSANSAPLTRNFNIIPCRAADSGEGLYNEPSQSVFQLGQISLVRLIIIANFIIDQCRQPAVVERNIAPEQHDLE
jgi:hypothetical protein